MVAFIPATPMGGNTTNHPVDEVTTPLRPTTTTTTQVVATAGKGNRPKSARVSALQ